MATLGDDLEERWIGKMRRERKSIRYHVCLMRDDKMSTYIRRSYVRNEESIRREEKDKKDVTSIKLKMTKYMIALNDHTRETIDYTNGNR